MKKVYTQPEWKLSIFEQEDVITASTYGSESDLNNTENFDPWWN